MSDILNDLSTPTLIAAIKANLFDWYRHVGSSPKAELCESPELTWSLTGIPLSVANAVLRTQVEPSQADAIIKGTLAHFRSKNVTSVSWWVEPDTRPADLGRPTGQGL